MSEFKAEPQIVLETLEDVRRVVETPDWRKNLGLTVWLVKPLALITLIDEIAKTEYPYNSVVKRRTEALLGYPVQCEAYYAREGDALSALIYNAQCYRGSDRLKAGGYEPFTQEVVERAGKGGKIEGSGGTVLNVREISGKLYAMKHRARNSVIMPSGQPVKIVKK